MHVFESKLCERNTKIYTCKPKSFAETHDSTLWKYLRLQFVVLVNFLRQNM